MSSFAQGRRISQETFDEVVQENVEEFEMSLQDAVQDAIVQFTKQGVDLSSVDTTGGEGREEMLNSLNDLHTLPVPVTDAASALTIVSNLVALCDKTHQFSQRNINLMNDKGGLNDLLTHFSANEDASFVLAVTRFIEDLSIASEPLRDFFEPGGSDKLVVLLRYAVQTNNSLLAEALLVLARTVSRSENNKVALMRAGAGTVIADILSNSTSSSSTLQTVVMEKACIALRGLCVHDDLRREMSCAFDNGKFFLKHAAVVPALIALAGQYDKQSESDGETDAGVSLASAAMAAAKALVTTNDAVQILSLHGVNDLLTKLLREAVPKSLPMLLLRSAVGLLRNLVADDARKDQLVAEGVMELLISLLHSDGYGQDGVLVEHSLGCLAQFSLRSPSNSQRIVDCGVAIDLIVKAMRKFFDRDGLQRQACLTIRNIAARCPELRPTLLDCGVEPVLRDAGRITTVVDEAYSALRDLGIDVQYVKVTDKGTVMPAYEQFGSTALNFRPIYDEADGLETRVQDEARAPFAHDHVHRHLDDDDDCDCCH